MPPPRPVGSSPTTPDRATSPRDRPASNAVAASRARLGAARASGAAAIIACALALLACNGAAPGEATTPDAAPARDTGPADGVDPPDTLPSAIEDTPAPRDSPTAHPDDAGGDGDAPRDADGGAREPDAAPAEDVDADAEGDAATPCEPDAPCDPPPPVAPCTAGRCGEDGACHPTPIPGCCETAADCGDLPLGGPCDVRVCAGGQCALGSAPGCCIDDADCDDGVACTADRCVADEGRCGHCPTACVCAPAALDVAFDGATPLSALGFTTTDPAPGDGVTWRPTDRRFVLPPGAAYLGRADCPTYYNGTLDAACAPVDPDVEDATRVVLSLNSPAFYLPAALPAPIVTLWLWAAVEPYLGLGAGEPDVLRVVVVPLDGAPAHELGSSLAVGKSTSAGWRLLAFDLTPWRGRTVRLRFDFDTLDGQHNLHEGIYLDDLRVAGGCEAGGCCETDADCDGGDPLTCTTARCVTLQDTTHRLCAVVPTAPGAPCAPCAEDVDCADADPCTADRCGADGQCVHDAFCCFRQTLVTADFDDDLSGWIADAPTPDTDVAWRVSPWAFDGSGSAWFGDPATATYAAPAPVRGGLTSQPFQLPSTGSALEVAFALALSTEWDTAPLYDNPAGVDRLRLEALTAQHVVEIWSSDAVAGTTDGSWLPVVVPLDAFAGQTIQLRFTFDSVDDAANDHGGAHVDALSVRTACPSP